MGPPAPLEPLEEREQRLRLEALTEANRIRIRRSHIKRAIRNQFLTVADVLEDEAVQTMEILDLVRAAGRGKSGRRSKEDSLRVVERVTISHNREVGLLTERQRELLVEGLNEHGYDYRYNWQTHESEQPKE